jgi:uncharacterized protein YfaS (alpha-2-macroglobulin family)
MVESQSEVKSDLLLSFSGTINEKLSAMDKPFTTTISESDKLTVQKTGNTPIYLATMQKSWIRPSARAGDDFEVQTSFWQEDKPVTTFQSGKSLVMQVRIEVKKKGDYAMIEIPIPAGCTYNHSSAGTQTTARVENSQRVSYSTSNESHREYLKNKLCIFLEKIEPRTYTFSIPLQVRYQGTYTVNPAKIELMYFPIFNGYEAVKKVRVK